MLVSEIVGSGDRRPVLRQVGVHFAPDQQHRVMASAMDLYRHLGVDVDVQHDRISIACGEAISTPLMHLIERRTGLMGFNEWWGDTPI